MAEIPIQRKEGRNIWPLLLGLLALLAIIWLLMGRRRGDTTATVPDTTRTVATGTVTPGAVATFASFVGTTDPNRDETKQHEYTVTGLRHLADALAAVGASGPGLDSMRTEATALQNSPANSTQHADMARSAFMSAASVMASLQTQRFPNMANDVAGVRQAAQAVKPGTHLLEQKDQIQTFFERARDALQTMTRTTS